MFACMLKHARARMTTNAHTGARTYSHANTDMHITSFYAKTLERLTKEIMPLLLVCARVAVLSRTLAENSTVFFFHVIHTDTRYKNIPLLVWARANSSSSSTLLSRLASAPTSLLAFAFACVCCFSRLPPSPCGVLTATAGSGGERVPVPPLCARDKAAPRADSIDFLGGPSSTTKKSKN